MYKLHRVQEQGSQCAVTILHEGLLNHFHYLSALHTAPFLWAKFTQMPKITLEKPPPWAPGPLKPGALHRRKSQTKPSDVAARSPSQRGPGMPISKTKWHGACRVNYAVQDVIAAQKKTLFSSSVRTINTCAEPDVHLIS